MGAGRQQGSSTQSWHPQHSCAWPLVPLGLWGVPGAGRHLLPACCALPLWARVLRPEQPFLIPAPISCLTPASAFPQEAGDNNQFCWRNLFSCINLLRILNKLTKWKHSRTMVRAGEPAGAQPGRTGLSQGAWTG